MSLKESYFEYLRHIGRSVTVRELHEHPEHRNAIALRHDIDHDLDLALEMAHHEHARGMRATYFLLHSHDYWRDEQFILKCRQIEAYGHEVGLHLNVVTEWMSGRCGDVDQRLRELLDPLREAGLSIHGVSAHGDRACYDQGFINYWIWRELRGEDPARDQQGMSAEGIAVDDPDWQVHYPDDHALRRADGAWLELWRSSLAEHGLRYDAMHVPIDRYWTDSGGSWARRGDPLEADLTTGRHQILVHPHWWRGPKRIYYVLSTARSGSKWLANFVERATSCRGLHEWTLNHRRDGAEMVADKRTHTDYVGLIDDRTTSPRLVREAAAHFRTLRGDVLEANVYLEPFAPMLGALGDDVTVIHLHRDGRDVVRSLLNRNWYDTPGDRRHRAVPIDGWDDLDQLQRCCWYYRHTTEALMSHAERRFRFETMVTEFDALTAWLEALGIVVHPLLAVAEFPRRINASKNPRFPRFDEWPREQRAAFEWICAPVQEALAYPVDKALVKHAALLGRMRRSKRRAANLIDLDLTGRRSLKLSAAGVRCTRDERGLRAATIKRDDPTAHLLLTTGSWREVRRRHGLRCDHWSYYVCRIEAEATAGMAARLFVLWYEKDGALMEKEHLASVRADATTAVGAFAAVPGSSHFALALHLGNQAPEQAMTVRSILLRSIPLGERYRAVPGAAPPNGS